MTDQLDDMTSPDAIAAVEALIFLVNHAPACSRRLEKLKRVEATIKREGEEVAAARAENDRKLKHIDDRITAARRREFDANGRIEVLRGLLGKYEKTKQLPSLPENFEAESAELIAADEAASEDWVAAAEQRAAANERARAG